MEMEMEMEMQEQQPQRQPGRCWAVMIIDCYSGSMVFDQVIFQ
jgi:hypothetical protein